MSDSDTKVPPKGDIEKAEKYISQLVDLINQNRIEVFHTDLKKFDPTSLQDHYTIALKDYQIEISHSKQPNSNKDSFVMIFNNFKNISASSSEKVILAYVYLADSHFSKFKIVADRQIEERRRALEEKRFKEAIAPIDNLLESATNPNPDEEDSQSTNLAQTQNANSSESYLTEQQIHQI